MQSCRFEEHVLAAVAAARRGQPLPEAVRRHMQQCPACAAATAVAGALGLERDRLAGFAPCPDPGLVWRRLQRRAWDEAAAAAGRPITAMQVLALAAAGGVAGACYGATSGWFQAALRRFAHWTASVLDVSFPPFAAAQPFWIAAAIAAAALLIGVPLALWLALASGRR